MRQLGTEWFEQLLTQNPRWVRGTATPSTLLLQSNTTEAASFTGGLGLSSGSNYNISFPSDAEFVSWPQTGAILKAAPHPEGAKLLHSYMLSLEHQTGGWSVRQDVGAPNGTSYPDISKWTPPRCSCLCSPADRQFWSPHVSKRESCPE